MHFYHSNNSTTALEGDNKLNNRILNDRIQHLVKKIQFTLSRRYIHTGISRIHIQCPVMRQTHTHSSQSLMKYNTTVTVL